MSSSNGSQNHTLDPQEARLASQDLLAAIPDPLANPVSSEQPAVAFTEGNQPYPIVGGVLSPPASVGPVVFGSFANNHSSDPVVTYGDPLGSSNSLPPLISGSQSSLSSGGSLPHNQGGPSLEDSIALAEARAELLRQDSLAQERAFRKKVLVYTNIYLKK